MTKKTLPMRRQRNSLPVTEEDRGRYPAHTYVGAIIAPKLMAPVVVYANEKEADRFRVFTPDRRLVVGAGYYGDEGPEGCTRQHMLPGLVDSADSGTGLGTTLYIAGCMTIAASEQNASRSFPWRGPYSQRECTFSIKGDRSEDAERAWENLVRHGLAREEEIDGDPEEIEDTFDVEDYIDESDVERDFERQNDIVPDNITVSGTITVYGTKYEIVDANFMDWSHIKDVGLILHLSPFFDDPEDHEPIPPGVFAEVDWTTTPDEWFLMFAHQNAMASGHPEDWLQEAACHIGGIGSLEDLSQEGTHLAHLLLRGRSPNPCPTRFAKKTLAWKKKFGPSAWKEANPARKLKRKLLR